MSIYSGDCGMAGCDDITTDQAWTKVSSFGLTGDYVTGQLADYVPPFFPYNYILDLETMQVLGVSTDAGPMSIASILTAATDANTE